MTDASASEICLSSCSCGMRMAEKPSVKPMLRLDRKQNRHTRYWKEEKQQQQKSHRHDFTRLHNFRFFFSDN